MRAASLLPPGRIQGLKSDHQAWRSLCLLSRSLTDFKISNYGLLSMPVLNTDESVAEGFADTHI